MRYDTVPTLISGSSLHVYEMHSKNLKDAFVIVSRFHFVENVIILGDRINFFIGHNGHDDV